MKHQIFSSNIFKGKSISTYTLIFLLIYTSHDTLLFGTNNSSVFQIMGYILTLSVVFVFFIRYMKQQFVQNSKGSVLLFFFMFFSVVTSITNLDFTLKYGYEILLFIGAFFITSLIPFNQFRSIFSNIILFLALFSLLTTILYYVAYSVVTLFPTISNSSNLDYHYLFFSTLPTKMEYTYFRNYGIFREPGIYMIFLNIACVFELFSGKSVNYKRILILVLALFFTFSTGGYIVFICMFLIFAIKSLSVKKNINGVRTFIYTILGIIAIVLVLTTNYIFDVVFGKLFIENASSQSRFSSISNNLKLLSENPFNIFFGLGYFFIEHSFLLFEKIQGSGSAHNTNTIFKILSIHGFIYTGVILYTFIRFWFKYFRINAFYLSILFLMMLSNGDLIVNILIYIVSFYSVIKSPNCISVNKH